MTNNKISIFCVDDDRISRLMMEKILESFDCTLIESGEDCLKEIHNKEPDLILLDIEMPGLNGMDTCKQIRAKGFEHVSIVFLSANGSLPERLEGYQAGGDDFIQKPFDVKELILKVNTVISKKQLLDKAHQTIKDTTRSATDAMRTLGETGIVIHFLQSTFECNSYDSLAQKIVQSHKQFALNISIEMTINGEYLYYNLKNSLEQSVFEYVRNRGRLIHSGCHTIVNYPGLSIFIHNMPIDNPELYGRIKDYTALIGQGAYSKLKALKAELFAKKQRQNLLDFINNLAITVKQIDQAYIDQQLVNENILSELIDEIEEAFTILEMTEKQEKNLRNYIQKAAQKTQNVHDTGLAIDKEFELLIKYIKLIAEENNTEYKEADDEEVNTEVLEEDGDVLLF
ncbi:MAG: response regulator [Gammaproteobacteria bacterium]|nr:response regulator [Gammaproteobacteria bacterium]